MIKISQRESRTKGKDCSTLPHSEKSQPVFIPSGTLIYQVLQVEVSQWKHKSKGISVADVYAVTQHMNFTLKKRTSLSSWAQTISFRYFSGFIFCHKGKLRQSGLGGTSSRDGRRGIQNFVSHQITNKMPFAVTLRYKLSSGNGMRCSNRHHNRKDTLLSWQSLFHYIYHPKLTGFIIRHTEGNMWMPI